MKVIKKLSETICQKPLPAIILFHIVTRVLAFAIHPNVTIFNDTEGYTGLAALMLDFNLSGYEGYRSPGYPLLLFLSGNVLPVTVFLQIVLGIFTSIFAYRTLRLLDFNKKGAVYIILLFNSFFHVIFYEFAILTESFTLFFVTICFYYVVRLFIQQSQTWTDAVRLSALLGFLVIIKPFYIFIPFLIYGLYLLRDFRLNNLAGKTVFMLFLPLSSFLGWSYVNKINTGYFTSTTFSGLNISQNCVSFAENTTPEYAEIGRIYAKYRDINISAGNYTAMSIWDAHEEISAATGLSGPDLFHELGKYGKATIKKNPLPYAKQFFISWRDFWRTSIYYNFEDFNPPFWAKVVNSLWLLQNKVLLLFKLIFLLLIPYHAYIYLTKRYITSAFAISVIIFCASVLQAAFTYGNNSRFSYPFEFLMIITLIITFRARLKLLFESNQKPVISKIP